MRLLWVPQPLLENQNGSRRALICINHWLPSSLFSLSRNIIARSDREWKRQEKWMANRAIDICWMCLGRFQRSARARFFQSFKAFLLSTSLSLRLLLNNRNRNVVQPNSIIPTLFFLCYSSQRILVCADRAEPRLGHSSQHCREENQIFRWRRRSYSGKSQDQQLSGRSQRWESNFGCFFREIFTFSAGWWGLGGKCLVKALEGKTEPGRREHKRCVAVWWLIKIISRRASLLARLPSLFFTSFHRAPLKRLFSLFLPFCVPHFFTSQLYCNKVALRSYQWSSSSWKRGMRWNLTSCNLGWWMDDRWIFPPPSPSASLSVLVKISAPLSVLS